MLRVSCWLIPLILYLRPGCGHEDDDDDDDDDDGGSDDDEPSNLNPLDNKDGHAFVNLRKRNSSS